VTLASSPPAHALISTVETIDGPSSDVIDVGGVAMSADGTGGIVYRKRVDGRIHVFAAQYAGGRWRAPQRVDNGQAFDSSWPTIGAADGGRLVVTWVQEFGAADRLFGATLSPGAARFASPVPIDLNVGDPIALQPSIAVNAGGAAYLTYLVAEEDPNLPPGTVRGELRLARYGGQLWSTLGFPLNRNPAAPVRRPTPVSGPRVTIDAAGNGALVFQEPDDEQVDRIWARRLFGTTTGIPLQLSPSTFGDRPLRGAADAFDADTAGFGQTSVAFRQRSSPGAALAGTRVMVATLPESFTEDAGKVQGPVVVDGGAPDQAPPSPEAPRVSSIPGGQFLAAYGIGTSTFLVGAGEQGLQRPQRIDTQASSVTSTPLADAAPSGASAVAYRQQVGARGSVVVREVRSDGVDETKALSTPRGGPIETLAFAGRASATASRAGSRARARSPRSPPRSSTRRPTSSPSTRPRTSSSARTSCSGGTRRPTRSAACATRSPSTTTRSSRTSRARACRSRPRTCPRARRSSR
jgi:hypothetical protein